MTKKTQARNKGKAESKELRLKKETLKDLDAKKAKGVRGGMLNLSGGKGCDVGVIQDKKVVEVGTANCTATCGPKVCY